MLLGTEINTEAVREQPEWLQALFNLHSECEYIGVF